MLNLSVFVIERFSDGWFYTGKYRSFVEAGGTNIVKLYTRKGSASGALTAMARDVHEVERRNSLKEKYGADYWRKVREDTTPDWYDLSDEEKQAYKDERWRVVEYKLAPVDDSAL